MSNPLFLIINYNYGRIVMKNARIWSAVGSKYDVVLVDDQSPFDDLADIAA